MQSSETWQRFGAHGRHPREIKSGCGFLGIPNSAAPAPAGIQRVMPAPNAWSGPPAIALGLDLYEPANPGATLNGGTESSSPATARIAATVGNHVRENRVGSRRRGANM